MKLVVIGGHSRNIGKTSVAAGLIAATRELGWTAMKLTQYGHQVCSTDGEGCDCAAEDPTHPYAITREESLEGRSDSSRFLAAGAVESYWVRTPQGRLAEAMPSIRRLIEGRSHVILESNSVMRFLRPDVYVAVLDYETADFKASAQENLDRADAFVAVATAAAPAWEGVPRRVIDRRPLFHARPPEWVGPELVSFVRAKIQ